MKLSEISQLSGIEYCHCLSIIAQLEIKGICNVKLAVYHKCQTSPVDLLDFGVGFPKYHQCPKCRGTEPLQFDFIVSAAGEPDGKI